MNTKPAAPVIMAERRAVVWARLEAHRAALADRRARRWNLAAAGCLYAFAAAVVALCIGAGLRAEPVVNWSFAGCLLSLVAAYCCAERGVK